VGVFVNGDFVSAAKMIRRGRRNFVVNSAPKIIAADHFQPGRIWILPILHYPHPAAFIETDLQRLRDNRLGEDLLPFQAVRYFKTLRRLLRSHWAGLILVHSGLLFFARGGNWQVKCPKNSIAE